MKSGPISVQLAFVNMSYYFQSWACCCLSKCRFVIGREKPGEQSEVAQLIQQTLEQERWQREMMEQRYNQYMDEQEVGLHVQGWYFFYD